MVEYITIFLKVQQPYNMIDNFLEGKIHMIDFSPLWETMKQKNISQYQLIQRGIDKHTLDHLRNNKGVTTHTIEKLCDILECTPEKIFKFIKEDEKK